MTISEIPALVRRKTSLTVRHRLTPAMTFSTIIRTLEIETIKELVPHAQCPTLGFFWAAGEDPAGS